MSYQFLVLSVADHIATVTINRPDKLNALNDAVIGELGSAFAELRGRDDVRAVLVTGAGRAFVAGADISELAEQGPIRGKARALRGQAVFRYIEMFSKPVVAAVNGFALGGGCELAMACHVRIASDQAKFGQPEVKLGITLGYGGTQRLPRLVGKGMALQLLLTGETIDAAEALRIGLVNAVVPQPELLGFSRAWLGKVLANGPAALGMVLEVVDAGLDCGLEQGLQLEAAAFGHSVASEDGREGTRAFLEKRKPAFAGK